MALIALVPSSSLDPGETLHAALAAASHLGERSIGHRDPGATSSALLPVSLAEVALAMPRNLEDELRFRGFHAT